MSGPKGRCPICHPEDIEKPQEVPVPGVTWHGPYPLPQTSTTGWECPRCHRTYSPSITTCQHCGPKIETTANTLTVDQVMRGFRERNAVVEQALEEEEKGGVHYIPIKINEGGHVFEDDEQEIGE